MMRFDHAMCIEEFSIEFFKTYSDNVKLYDGRTQKLNMLGTHVNGERARYNPIQFLNAKIQIKKNRRKKLNRLHSKKKNKNKY